MSNNQVSGNSVTGGSVARHVLSPFNNVAQNMNLNPMSAASQKLKILAVLVRGERLTAIAALSRFSCARLAARIDDLRGDGWPIISESIKVVNRDGKTVRVAEYYLDLGAL